MSEAASVDLHCSAQARTGSIRPIGTAVPVRTFAVIELPLPWPAHIDEHPTLAGVEDALGPLDARLQGLVPSAEARASGEYRVALYFRRDGMFRRYERIERTGALTDLVVTCKSLVAEVLPLISAAETGDKPADHDASPAAPAGVVGTGAADDAATSGTSSAERELLVCTHGARDRCCGSKGTVAFASLDPRDGLRVGRTSHLGGHRFAPTAALLPEGTVWAWLDATSLAGILDRSVPVASVIDRYRGSAAMDSPPVQAAEAAVFAEVGWSWLDEERSGEVVEHAGDRWTIRIASTAGGWLAEVVNLGDVPQPKCGSNEPSGKTDPQLEVVALTREG